MRIYVGNTSVIPDAIFVLSFVDLEEAYTLQVVLVFSELSFKKLVSSCLSIIREIKEMDQFRLFFLNGLPTKIDNAF